MKIRVDAYIESLDEIRYITIVDIPEGLKGSKAREYARNYVTQNMMNELSDIIIDIHKEDIELNPLNYFTLKLTFLG